METAFYYFERGVIHDNKRLQRYLELAPNFVPYES